MENSSFFLVAVGHYGAEQAAVSIETRSTNPAKQLIELDCLEASINRALADAREQLSSQLPRVRPA